MTNKPATFRRFVCFNGHVKQSRRDIIDAMKDYQAELEFAYNLARRSAKVIRQHFDAYDFSIEEKSDRSPVTATDKQINQMVIDAVHESFPGDSVLAEEGSDIQQSGGRYWVCDPIDGTAGFIYGCPTAVFSLAFVVDGESQVAVVADPFLERTYTATKGGGAYLGNTRLRVSDHADLRGARVGLTSSTDEILKLGDYIRHYQAAGVWHSPYSGIVHQYMNVALGRLHARVYNGPKSHDVAAASLIVTEAGGMATDRSGKPLRLDGEIDGAIISNGQFHDQLVTDIDQFDVRPKTVRG